MVSLTNKETLVDQLQNREIMNRLAQNEAEIAQLKEVNQELKKDLDQEIKLNDQLGSDFEHLTVEVMHLKLKIKKLKHQQKYGDLTELATKVVKKMDASDPPANE
eukprot:NODE_1130_length_2074_cov_0.745823.p2 type:complete len:105 gc:universal NODE_1130_length_2074_cov_0.745823:1790-1476(-)